VLVSASVECPSISHDVSFGNSRLWFEAFESHAGASVDEHKEERRRCYEFAERGYGLQVSYSINDNGVAWLPAGLREYIGTELLPSFANEGFA